MLMPENMDVTTTDVRDGRGMVHSFDLDGSLLDFSVRDDRLPRIYRCVAGEFCSLFARNVAAMRMFFLMAITGRIAWISLKSDAVCLKAVSL